MPFSIQTEIEFQNQFPQSGVIKKSMSPDILNIIAICGPNE